MASGWYRLTRLGASIKKHDQIVTPRVPRSLNPGPAPNLHPLGTDVGLLKQLHVIWEEAVLCHDAGAHLSTIIMLGSLLEGALLTRALDEREGVGHARSSPRDAAGRVQQFEKWNLNDYINVAKECRWIHESRSAFADVLREYRNLVHPFKARHYYYIDNKLATICWQVIIATLRDLGVDIG